MAFRIEASDRHGARLYDARSAREAIDTIADLLNASFRIDRLTDHNGISVDYEDIIRADRVALICH